MTCLSEVHAKGVCMNFDPTLFLMLLIPSAVCIAIGVIIQVANKGKKNKPAAGPVLTVSGALFAALSLVIIFTLGF